MISRMKSSMLKRRIYRAAAHYADAQKPALFDLGPWQKSATYNRIKTHFLQGVTFMTTLLGNETAPTISSEIDLNLRQVPPRVSTDRS